jgi:hypothetical protein
MKNTIANTTGQNGANQTDPGNGSYGICRVIAGSRSPSPDLCRSERQALTVFSGRTLEDALRGYLKNS